MAKEINRAELFEDFYADMHGNRWVDLRYAFSQEPVYTELKEGLLQPYYLDKASVIAARALDVSSGGRVLDMCAAPGGKTLVLALSLGANGTLVANDRSSKRRERLHHVLNNHLPQPLAAKVKVTGHDATKWCLYEQDAYDRILLDVPCSSERHVLSSPKHLAMWSPSRTKNLAAQAYAFLAGAIRVLKPGGILVYSTCTISDRENDEVVAKLVKKRGSLVSLETHPAEMGEKTEYGWRIWPDRSDGAGPIYFSTIRRQA